MMRMLIRSHLSNARFIVIAITITALCAVLLLVSTTSFSYDKVSAQHVQGQQSLSIPDSNNLFIAKISADNLRSQLNKSAAIMEFTSTLPEVKKVPFADSISSSLHGISGDKDIEKRMVARMVLSKYPDFETIRFLLPNGDMYLLEPYPQQLNLTKNNFAFRDYYKGATTTHKTYLSEVFLSVATGHKVAVIAVPIYSPPTSNNNTKASLVGIWAGALDLNIFNKLLGTLNASNNNSRIVYLDQHGNNVADSGSNKQQQSQSSSKLVTHYVELQSFKNALTDKSGATTESINGTKTLVSYSPAKAVQAKWVVLVLQPNAP